MSRQATAKVTTIGIILKQQRARHGWRYCLRFNIFHMNEHVSKRKHNYFHICSVYISRRYSHHVQVGLIFLEEGTLQTRSVQFTHIENAYAWFINNINTAKWAKRVEQNECLLIDCGYKMIQSFRPFYTLKRQGTVFHTRNQELQLY